MSGSKFFERKQAVLREIAGVEVDADDLFLGTICQGNSTTAARLIKHARTEGYHRGKAEAQEVDEGPYEAPEEG